MRTCSSSSNPVGESSPNPTSSNPKRRNRRRSKHHFILEESPVDTMADQRTMAELLRAPTEGYAEAIMVPPILAEQFELKHNIVSKFINEFFPPTRTTNLRNEISNFQQRFDESFHEAWDHYKDLLCACPHHGFTELHQLDTFYNALNPTDQDFLNSPASGNLLERQTQVKFKVRNSRNKLIVSQVKSSYANSSSSSEIAKHTHAVNQQTSVVTTAMTAILKHFQATPPPASVKAVEEICVTCGGAHSYYQCLTADGNTFPELRDNIQGYVSAAAVNYNQVVPLSELEKIKKMNEINMKAMQTQINNVKNELRDEMKTSIQASINTIANSKGEMKAITSRSGLVLNGPFVHMPPSFINPKEDERVEETLTDPELAVILKKLPKKLRDPRKFLISCGFSELKCKAVDDLSASINLMPLSIWKKLGVPFLRTARALIDVYGEEMILCDGDERLTLKDLFATNHQSGNPTFSSHTDLTSSEVNDYIFDSEGDIVLMEKLLNLDSTKYLHPPHNINPLSGSTTSSSPTYLLKEFADELALITFLPGNDDLPFNIEFDLREIEYLLNHDPTKEMDYILKDLIDKDNLTDPNDNLFDTIPEMFTDEHTFHYSSPSLYDEYNDLCKFEFDNEYAYDDPFDSKEDKIKESKLLIDELDLPRSSDFLPSLEYDSFLFEDFSEVDALPSANNEDKVFNLGILVHENLSENTIQVTPDKNEKKISNASLILEDFDLTPCVFGSLTSSINSQWKVPGGFGTLTHGEVGVKGPLLLPPPYHQFTSSSSGIRSNMTRKLGATGVSWMSSTLREALQITHVNNNQAFIPPPSSDALRNLSNVGVVTRTHIDYAERIWEEFTQSIHTFIEDKWNLSRHTSRKKKATLIVIPSIRFTKLIIHHLQRRHKFHPRPDSLLHLPNEEHVLGYLKFNAKGTNREVFVMPIPGSLIIADIQEASYYQEYLAKVAQHRRKPKSTAPKAPPRPSVSTPVISAQPAPTSAPAKPQEKKRKQTIETSDKPSKAKKSKYGFVGKKRSVKSVVESVAEDAPAKEPQVTAKDANLEKALEESIKSIYDVPRGPLHQWSSGNPCQRNINRSQRCQERAKQGRTSEPTGSSRHNESSYVVLGQSDSKEDSEMVMLGADEGGKDEGQARPDPVVHAGSNHEHMDLDVADVSPQPSTEQLEEGFTATAYSKVQKNLKLTVEEQLQFGHSSLIIASRHELTSVISRDDDIYKMANVNAPSGQAPEMAPPVHTDDQILPRIRNVSNVVTNDMFQPWRALITIINLCLMGKTSGFERPRAHVLQILWGIIKRANIDYAERIWEEFTQSIHTFIEDKRNLSRHTSGKKRATLIVIPSIRYTKLIIHHLQRRHKFNPRPKSSLTCLMKSRFLDISSSVQRVQRGKSSECLFRVALSLQTFKRLHTTGNIWQKWPSISGIWPVSKKRTLKNVEVSMAEEVPVMEPQVAAEDTHLQKALEESMKTAYALPRGPLPPVVIREPKSKKYQPLPEVPGKGKAKVTEEEVAHDLLSLQKHKKTSPADQYILQRRVFEPTGSSGHDDSLYDLLRQSDSEEDQKRPKKKSSADQYIFQRRTSEPTGSSRHNESSYVVLGQSDSKEDSEKVMLGADEGGKDEGQARPDPGAQAEGQTGSDAADELSTPSAVVHAGSNHEHMDLDVADVSPQPSTEQLN
nr:hypothetical protein [Tanacetum cinerariifolium]